jgi:hypothetical protein
MICLTEHWRENEQRIESLASQLNDSMAIAEYFDRVKDRDALTVAVMAHIRSAELKIREVPCL